MLDTYTLKKNTYGLVKRLESSFCLKIICTPIQYRVAIEKHLWQHENTLRGPLY